MGIARATLRLLAITLVTSFHYVIWFATRITALISDDLAKRTHHRIVSSWARAMLASLGVEVVKHGEAPQPPFFLVSNHLSYIDIPVLLAHTDGVLLAKSEVARWPIVGHLARVTGTLFIDRDRKSDLLRVVKAVKGSLDAGWGVVVFPEGTSSSGEFVLPFKSSIFEVAVQSGCRVHHASVSYETTPPAPPARLSVCWWGDMGFLPHFLRLLTLPTISAQITFGDAPVEGSNRKELSKKSHDALQHHFKPVLMQSPVSPE